MSTPVGDIFRLFLGQIGEDIITELEDEVVDDLLLGYLEGAITEFHECKKDLTISYNGVDCVINDDLTLDEKYILSRGMLLYWLQPKINTEDLIRNRITDGDYTIKSPANLLEKLLKLKDSTEKDLKRRKINYSYRGKNINE